MLLKINNNHIGRILRYIFSCQGLLPRRQRVLFFGQVKIKLKIEI
jgi:hypothetical protein